MLATEEENAKKKGEKLLVRSEWKTNPKKVFKPLKGLDSWENKQQTEGINNL